MRYLTAACPEFRRVILVESGPRAVMESAIPRLRNVFGPQTAFDLVTCHAGRPSTLETSATLWRTADHHAERDRARLIRELKASGATAVAIICSGHPIMTRWKWWLAWKLPVKVLIINENADCYWLDTAHLHSGRAMAMVRLGLSGGMSGKENGVRTLLRLAVFPFGLFYLLLYASVLHLQRLIRIGFTRRGSERS